MTPDHNAARPGLRDMFAQPGYRRQHQLRVLTAVDFGVPQHLAVGPPGPLGAATQVGRSGACDEVVELGAHSFQLMADVLPVGRLTVDGHEPVSPGAAPRGNALLNAVCGWPTLATPPSDANSGVNHNPYLPR